MITLTNEAHTKITKHLAKRGTGLGIRIGVKTTGCSGLAYVLEYIDFKKNGLNEGFEFGNPNAKDHCGCGESFRI